MIELINFFFAKKYCDFIHFLIIYCLVLNKFQLMEDIHFLLLVYYSFN